MKVARYIPLFVALLLVGCQTTQQVARSLFKKFSPIPETNQEVRYKDGAPFIHDKRDVEIVLGANPKWESDFIGQFYIEIYNHSRSAVTIGLSNLSVQNPEGLVLYTRTEGELQDLIFAWVKRTAKSRAKAEVALVLVAQEIEHDDGRKGGFRDAYERRRAQDIKNNALAVEIEKQTNKLTAEEEERMLGEFFRRQTVLPSNSHSAIFYADYPEILPSEMIFNVIVGSESYRFSFLVEDFWR